MPLFMQGDRIADEAGHTWAAVSHVNPLDVGFPVAGPQRIVAWTGWYGDESEPAAGLFPRDFRTWTPRAWEALRSRIEAAAESRPSTGELLLRPHSRHVISDPQACVMLLKDLPQGVGILLDPVSMLTPDMLPAAEDHIARALEIAAFPRIAGVLIAGAERIGDDQIGPTAAGMALPRETVRALADRRAPGVRQIVLA